MNPWHKERSDWVWAHQIKSLISAAQGPVISVVFEVVVGEIVVVVADVVVIIEFLELIVD